VDYFLVFEFSRDGPSVTAIFGATLLKQIFSSVLIGCRLEHYSTSIGCPVVFVMINTGQEKDSKFGRSESNRQKSGEGQQARGCGRRTGERTSE
jgi:hypothetical protein